MCFLSEDECYVCPHINAHTMVRGALETQREHFRCTDMKYSVKTMDQIHSGCNLTQDNECDTLIKLFLSTKSWVRHAEPASSCIKELTVFNVHGIFQHIYNKGRSK